MKGIGIVPAMRGNGSCRAVSFHWGDRVLTVENTGNIPQDAAIARWRLLLDGRETAAGDLPVPPLAAGGSCTVVLPAWSGRARPNVSPATWGERHLNVEVRDAAGVPCLTQFPADYRQGLYPPVPRIQPMRRKGEPLFSRRVDVADGTSFSPVPFLSEIEWLGEGVGDDIGFAGLWRARRCAIRELKAVRRVTFVGGGERLEIAALRGSFSLALADGRAVVSGIDPRLLVFDDWNPEAELVLTAPFQQNVGTDAFSICLETSRAEPSLRLVVDGVREIPFEYRLADFSGTFFAVAHVTDCAPGSVVKYDLSCGDFPGEVHLWKDCEDDFKCAIWSDFQCGSMNGPSLWFDWEDDPFRCGEMMFRDMIAEKCDFAVSTGDMADVGDYAKELRPLYLERTCGTIGRVMPFYIAFGNHDSIHPENHFFVENPSKGSFAFVKNNCLFLCIDDIEVGNDKTPARPELVEFVERTLSSEAARRAKFVFAFQHVAVYEEAFGNCNRNLLPLYEKYGVDAVFSGDHHGYERIVRGGLLQVVNGCMGYFWHQGGLVNWFGDETVVGGHKDLAASWRFQKEGERGVLGPAAPVSQGLIPGYATLEVRGDVAEWKLHAFNADGSKVGVVDSFVMRRGERPHAPRGMATEYFAWNKPGDPAWGLLFTLTGKGGRVVRLSDWGAVEVAEGVSDFRSHYEAVKDAASRWKGKTFHDLENVGVEFTLEGDGGSRRVRRYTLKPDNSLEFSESLV